MGFFSLTHVLILILIVIVVTRPARVTDLLAASKKALRNFRDAKNEIEAEYEEIQSQHPPGHDKDRS